MTMQFAAVHESAVGPETDLAGHFFLSNYETVLHGRADETARSH
jgi:hypothetical protein